MTMTANTYTTTDTQPAQMRDTMSVSVQVLSTVLFAAFAIPVTIVALNVFWPAGVVIALILAWRGGFAPTGAPSAPPRNIDEAIKSLMPVAANNEAHNASSNASFDAYHHDMIERLEVEKKTFDGFLGRLREAKDQSEFDDFMDERAARVDADTTPHN
jgi:hypothetical protein